MEPSNNNSIWQTSKLLMKALIIGGLTLLLLIPAYYVQQLVLERQETQQQASREISARWAGRQNITGPVLVIPYTETVTGPRGVTVKTKRTAYILPDSLTIDAGVKPEKKYRGIYQIMLYSSEITMRGKFSAAAFAGLKLNPDSINWDDVYVSVGIADPKGMADELVLTWNDQEVPMNVSTVVHPVLKAGFVAPVRFNPADPITFSSRFRLNGSEQLLFSPVGRETTVRLKSAWPDPSFTGSELPTHQISSNGFNATWKSLPHNHNYPQAWKDEVYNLQSASFGADLFIQVNNYQKIMRSAKYAFLCIILTFAAFFLVEISSRKSIHPVQYGLVGLALILFYTLLLSISEYTGFDLAYLFATIATVLLIAWFVKGLLQSSRLSAVIAIVMSLLYSYVFCILQLQDLSLLLGSIGLFLTLAIVMKFSRKLQW